MIALHIQRIEETVVVPGRFLSRQGKHSSSPSISQIVWLPALYRLRIISQPNSILDELCDFR